MELRKKINSYFIGTQIIIIFLKDDYVVVPAGKQLAIKDGDTEIKSTTAAGLKAGFYYCITLN